MNIILFSVKGESLPGGVLGPFQNCPVFPCSHTFSLFVPLLINLLTTYYRPQFPPAKTKDTKNKTSICVTSSQAFERNSQSIRVGWALELTLRWLDWIFWGWYLPTLSINYVGMSKDMEKRLPQLYYIKMKISYDLGFIAIGVAMAT